MPVLRFVCSCRMRHCRLRGLSEAQPYEVGSRASLVEVEDILMSRHPGHTGTCEWNPMGGSDCTCGADAIREWHNQHGKLAEVVAERDRLRSALSRIGEVLAEEGCSCDGRADDLPLEERCLSHRIENAWEAESRFIVKLICCGRDDGVYGPVTWEDAEEFREEYCSGPAVADPHVVGCVGGHQRSAIIERVAT